MPHPDLTVLDQRELAPARVRSLLRMVEHGERRWYVAELDRIVDCGRKWNRAAANVYDWHAARPLR